MPRAFWWTESRASLTPRYIQPSEAKSLETNVVEFKYEINDQEVAFEICDDMAFINAQKKRYSKRLLQ
jgi:hypothetical protein